MAGSDSATQEPQSPLDLKSPTAFETTDTDMQDVEESASKSFQDHEDDGGGEGDGDNVSNSGTNSTVKYDHEAFETFKGKVAQLCRDIGYGEPETIERMKGGGYNRVIGLHPTPAANPVSALVLRIPRYLDLDQAHEILDQVTVLSYLSNYDFLHVPEVVHYDSTEDNALSSMFTVQKRLPGVPIDDVYHDLPLTEKLQVTSIVAKLLLQMETIAFDAPGRPLRDRALPLQPKGQPNAEGLKIGGYRHDPMKDMPEIEDQLSLGDLLCKLFENQKEYDPSMDYACDRLIEITRQMEAAGFMRTTDNKYVAWHKDLSSSNILIERQKVDPSKSPETPSANLRRRQAVEVKVGNSDLNGPQHTIRVEVEDPSGTKLDHKIEVAVEDYTGKKTKHTIHMSTGDESSREDEKPTPPPSANTEQGKWAVSGVVDWDDCMALPLVLARHPPSWLWIKESDRPSRWMQDLDAPCVRDFNQEELLIKAHFDQIMERSKPGYIEDAYFRGVWLRRLSHLALEGFPDAEDFKWYEKLDNDWTEFYGSLSRGEDD